MSSKSAFTGSRADVQRLIKTSQTRILESLGALEVATASLPNREQIRQELHGLREALTNLWLACEAVLNYQKRLED
jgi:hypothetical protein